MSSLVERTIRCRRVPGTYPVSLRLVKASVDAEATDEVHMARLLLLIDAVVIPSRSSVDGITKLAKLDFLLRYPTCLERALVSKKMDPRKANVMDFERGSIESRMIRFRYGPWDPRYRRWLGLMQAKGLVRLFKRGRTVHVELTDSGKALANSLKKHPEFAHLGARAKALKSAVGSMSATALMRFVYELVPEIKSLKWGEAIEI